MTPQATLYACDFDTEDFCNWQLDTPDKPWIIATGQTAVYGKAPLTDHTKQNVFGKYAYVPVEPTGGPIYFASLSFRSLPQTITTCLDFWYQTFASSDTALTVYTKNGSAAAVATWSRPGTTARDQWTHASVNVVAARATTTVTISGMIAAQS